MMVSPRHSSSHIDHRIHHHHHQHSHSHSYSSSSSPSSSSSHTHSSLSSPFKSSSMSLSFFDHRNDEGGKKIHAFLSALLSPHPFSPLYTMKELSRGFCLPFSPPSLPSDTNESLIIEWIDKRKTSQWRGTLAALLSLVQINENKTEEKMESLNEDMMIEENHTFSTAPAFLSSLLIHLGQQLLLSQRPAAATLCFIAADSVYNVLYALGVRSSLNGVSYRLYAPDRSIDPLREAIFYLLIRSQWNSYSLNDCINNNFNNNNNNLNNNNYNNNSAEYRSVGQDLIMATLIIPQLFAKTFGQGAGNEEINESEWKSLMVKYNEKFSKYIGVSALILPPNFYNPSINDQNDESSSANNDDRMEEDDTMLMNNSINFDSPLSFGYCHRHRFAVDHRVRTSETEAFSQWISPSPPSPSHMTLDSRSCGKELSLFSAFTNEVNRLNDKEMENFTPYIFKVIPPSPTVTPSSLPALEMDDNDHFLSSFDSSAPPSPTHSLASICSSPSSSIASPPSSIPSSPTHSSSKSRSSLSSHDRSPSFSPLPPSAYHRHSESPHRHRHVSSSSHWLSSVRSSHPRLFVYLPHIHHHWLVSGTGIIRYLSRYYSEIDENHLEIGLGNISSRVWKIKGKHLHEGLFLLNTKLEFIDTNNNNNNKTSPSTQHSTPKNSSLTRPRNTPKRSSDAGKIKCKTEVYMPKEALMTILNYENNDQRLRHMFGNKTVDALGEDVMNYLMMLDEEQEGSEAGQENDAEYTKSRSITRNHRDRLIAS